MILAATSEQLSKLPETAKKAGGCQDQERETRGGAGLILHLMRPLPHTSTPEFPGERVPCLRGV